MSKGSSTVASSQEDEKNPHRRCNHSLSTAACMYRDSPQLQTPAMRRPDWASLLSRSARVVVLSQYSSSWVPECASLLASRIPEHSKVSQFSSSKKIITLTRKHEIESLRMDRLGWIVGGQGTGLQLCRCLPVRSPEQRISRCICFRTTIRFAFYPSSMN